MDLKIQAVDFDADQQLKDLIHRKVVKLEQYFDKIIDIEVFLRLENQGAQITEKSVQIKLIIPGDTLYAKESSKVIEEAVDLAVESLRRQLNKYKEKLRN